MNLNANSSDRVAILGGIRYKVQVADDQVIMVHNGIKTFELAFDRPLDKTTKKPSFWALSSMESSDNDKIPLVHLVDAFNYINEHFGKCHQKYKGELSVLNN